MAKPGDFKIIVNALFYFRELTEGNVDRPVYFCLIAN